MPIHAPIGNPDGLSNSIPLTDGGGILLVLSSSVASFGSVRSWNIPKKSSSNIGADCVSWISYVGSGVANAWLVFTLNVGSIVEIGPLVGVAVGEGHVIVHVDAELQYILPEPQVPNWDRQKLSRALTTQGAPVQRLISSSTLKIFTQASSRFAPTGCGVGGFGSTATLCEADFPTFPDFDFDPPGAFADFDDLPDLVLTPSRFMPWGAT
mmetsp:Transcript_36879/g.88952  ORF Transcript_36879/g.88952 Transcript_36879/m.88952 type:complete len:210 (+) Transcript_36879:600-1229(+)